MIKVKSNLESLLRISQYFPNNPLFGFNIEITSNSTTIKVTIPEGKSLNKDDLLKNILNDQSVKAANINLVDNTMIVSITY